MGQEQNRAITYEPEPMPDGFRLMKATYPAFIHEMGKLRINAWEGVPGVNPEVLSQEEWLEDNDKVGWHWLMLKGDEIAASSRMTLHHDIKEVPQVQYLPKSANLSALQFPVASMNRLVVHPDFRGRGFARRMDYIRMNAAAEAGAKTIVAGPIDSRIPLFIEYGFKYICHMNSTPELPGISIDFMYKYTGIAGETDKD